MHCTGDTELKAKKKWNKFSIINWNKISIRTAVGLRLRSHLNSKNEMLCQTSVKWYYLY